MIASSPFKLQIRNTLSNTWDTYWNKTNCTSDSALLWGYSAVSPVLHKAILGTPCKPPFFLQCFALSGCTYNLYSNDTVLKNNIILQRTISQVKIKRLSFLCKEKLCGNSLITVKVFHLRNWGYAIAQMACHSSSPGLITSQVKWDFGEQRGIGAGFLLVHQFSLGILIPPTVPYSLIFLSLMLYSQYWQYH
jgi:hypothetical protein